MEDPYAKIHLATKDSPNSNLHHFYKCSLDLLGVKEHHRAMVKIDFRDNTLYLQNADENDVNAIPLEHSHQCPVRELAHDKQIDTDPFVRLAVGILVENDLGQIFVTRRAKHLRTFPQSWVIPGGHIEPGESLEQAGIRELEEETGIVAKHENISLFALYESVFPVWLIHGHPSRHHIVVYFKVKIPTHELTVKLLPDEVEAAAWLDSKVIEEALSSTPSTSTFEATELVGTEWKTHHLPLRQLQNILIDGVLPAERLSTGTRFVLREWLKH